LKIPLFKASTHSGFPLPQNCFKLNFDVVIRENFSMLAAACRDSSGSVLYGWTKMGPPCDRNVGEAEAVLLAAQEAAS
jgi:hypothetical protein